MHKTLRRLPSLDFLRGFEAAGRRLSFTLAAQELFLTQSALSRQVKALEDALGVALFERRHRALALTPAGSAFHRAITSQLREVAAAAEALHAHKREPGLTVGTTVSFAALWLIPRLASFRALQPAVEVYVSADDRLVDLERGDVDVAVRYLADAGAPPGAARLFGERLLPVVSPQLMRRGAPLNGQPDLKPAGALRFSLYDQVIQATLGGQGVALGRIPLIAELLRDGRLVAPFPKRYDSPRGYFVVVAPHAREPEDVAAFVAWLLDEAAAQTTADRMPAAKQARRKRTSR